MPTTIDPASEAGARTLERLEAELIGWLTTTNPDGQPQSSPIWFQWIGDEVLVYSGKRAPRNGNVADRPLVVVQPQHGQRRRRRGDDGGRGPHRPGATPRPTRTRPTSPSTRPCSTSTAGRPSTSPANTRSRSSSADALALRVSLAQARPRRRWPSGPPSAWRPSPAVGRPGDGWWRARNDATTRRRSCRRTRHRSVPGRCTRR